MWELDHKENWGLKNWCFWTVVLEKILESPMDCKEIKPFNSEGNQSWISLWLPDAKNWCIGKNPDLGKDWRQEEKGMIKDEILGWHHRLDGHEFEQAMGLADRQGSLACCSPWSCKELDMTQWLNQDIWTIYYYIINRDSILHSALIHYLKNTSFLRCHFIL